LTIDFHIIREIHIYADFKGFSSKPILLKNNKDDQIYSSAKK